MKVTMNTDGGPISRGESQVSVDATCACRKLGASGRWRSEMGDTSENRDGSGGAQGRVCSLEQALRDVQPQYSEQPRTLPRCPLKKTPSAWEVAATIWRTPATQKGSMTGTIRDGAQGPGFNSLGGFGRGWGLPCLCQTLPGSPFPPWGPGTQLPCVGAPSPHVSRADSRSPAS